MAKSTKAAKPRFHYPSNISMTNSPLIEAWLTIQWELQGTDPATPLALDPGFNSALFKFSASVDERFGTVHTLDVTQIPEQLTPYRPRFQFRKGQNLFPLLQLGPGVASVNFAPPYSWKEFKETISWVRPKLVNAYKDHPLKTSMLGLTYRSAIPFNYVEESLQPWLKSHLNTSIGLPEYVPGKAASSDKLSTLDLSLSYNLKYPVGNGKLRIVTGNKKLPGETKEAPHIIIELEVASQEKIPALSDGTKFNTWLNAAHAVIHDWFLSLVYNPQLKEQLGLEGIDSL